MKILEQIAEPETLLAAAQQVIATARDAWNTAAALGKEADCIKAENAIAEADKSVQRLTVRLAALESQAAEERAQVKAEAVQHLKDKAVALGNKLEIELAAAHKTINNAVQVTYHLATLAQQVANARRTASQSGVIWDTAFLPNASLNELHKNAGFIDGNVANALQDWH